MAKMTRREISILGAKATREKYGVEASRKGGLKKLENGGVEPFREMSRKAKDRRLELLRKGREMEAADQKGQSL